MGSDTITWPSLIHSCGVHGVREICRWPMPVSYLRCRPGELPCRHLVIAEKCADLIQEQGNDTHTERA